MTARRHRRRFATAGSSSRCGSSPASHERSITITLILVTDYLHESAKLAELAQLVTAGTLTLLVAREIPAAGAAQAHRQLEAGGTRGPLVLTF